MRDHSGSFAEGDVKTTIKFVNNTAGVVKVYWLGYDGKRVYYSTLAAGKSYVQRTFETHPWVVLDGTGACIGYVIAPRDEYDIGAAAKRPTFTAVVCTIGVSTPTSTCTAQVADATPTRSNPPSGKVTFKAAAGIVGTSCSLAGTPGSPGIASCTVSSTPPSNLVQGEPPPVSAGYEGDGTFQASSGASGYHPASVIVPSTVSTTDSIPTDLTNPNPFPVSADEALTVAATMSAPMIRAGARSGVAPRGKLIGHATLTLRPLVSARVVVKLNPLGLRLLRKHKSLPATIIITTRAPGKPAARSSRRVTVKLS